MMQSEPIIHLKKSPAYYKILQLIVAIVLMVIVMNVGVSISLKDDKAIDQQFNYVAHQYIEQASAGVEVLLRDYMATTGQARSKNKKLQQFINNLTKAESVNQVHLYDKTGALIMQSNNATSINHLYGIALQSYDESDKFIPFVEEVRQIDSDESAGELLGYIRMTLEKSFLTKQLESIDRERSFFVRIMILLAGVVGFLLTRGFNRFSRQGYRPLR